MAGARRSISSSRSMRESRMSGEALTTHASLTMDFVLKFLGLHLPDGDTAMRELVDEFGPARARYLCGLRLGQFSLRVPEERRRDAHLLHELCRRQAQRREGAFRQIERYRGHGRASEQQDNAAEGKRKTVRPYAQTGRRGAP